MLVPLKFSLFQNEQDYGQGVILTVAKNLSRSAWRQTVLEFPSRARASNRRFFATLRMTNRKRLVPAWPGWEGRRILRAMTIARLALSAAMGLYFFAEAEPMLPIQAELNGLRISIDADSGGVLDLEYAGMKMLHAPPGGVSL